MEITAYRLSLSAQHHSVNHGSVVSLVASNGDNSTKHQSSLFVYGRIRCNLPDPVVNFLYKATEMGLGVMYGMGSQKKAGVV
jgi:hypothetical protein